MDSDFEKYLKYEKERVKELINLTTNINLSSEDRAINMVLAEKFELQEQLKQLEDKKQSISNNKYYSLKAEHEKTKKDLGVCKERIKSLLDALKTSSQLLEITQEKLNNLKPSKSGEKIKKLMVEIEELKNKNKYLQEDNIKLEQEKKEALSGVKMVSNDEYNGLVKQLEREIQNKEHWQKLYEQEKEKRTKLVEKYQNKIDTNELEAQIKALQEKLSNAGRKRNNNVIDAEIVDLHKSGLSLRKINEQTKLSINTIREILKKNQQS